jgi:excisionase family DNA binding protein
VAVGAWWWQRPGLVVCDETPLPTDTEDMMAEHELLTPAEVAVLFRVDPKTVTRWARAGKIPAIRTIGGHRRFRTSEIQRFLEDAQDLQP